jgi:hypothetical protein
MYGQEVFVALGLVSGLTCDQSLSLIYCRPLHRPSQPPVCSCRCFQKLSILQISLRVYEQLDVKEACNNCRHLNIVILKLPDRTAWYGFHSRGNISIPTRASLILFNMDIIKSGFAYHKLPEDDSQPIRLLKVHPSLDFDHLIECELLYSSLKGPDRIEFEAVSYAWGNIYDLANRGEILLHGQKQETTRNLEVTLRHLRLEDRERIL